MFEVGFTEIILILGLALLVLGPEKLPGLAEKIGRWTGRARAMARQLRTQLEQEVNLEEMARARPMQAPSPQSPADSPQPATSPPVDAEPAQSHETDTTRVTPAAHEEPMKPAHDGPGLDLDAAVSGLGPQRTPTDTTKPAP